MRNTLLVLAILASAVPALSAQAPADGRHYARLRADSAARAATVADSDTTADALPRAARLWEVAARAYHAADEKADEGRARLHLGLACVDLDRSDCATTALRSSVALATQSGDPATAARAFDAIGQLHYRTGDLKGALQSFRDATRADSEAGDRRHLVTAYIDLAAAYAALQRSDSAMSYDTTAWKLADSLHDSRNVGVALNNIGLIHHAVGEGDSALFYFRAAVTASSAAGDTSNLGAAFNSIGLYYDELAQEAATATRGALDSALSNYRRAFALVGDSTSLEAAAALNNIGVVHRRRFRVEHDRRDLDSAQAYYARVKTIEDAREDRAGLARTMQNIALAHGDAGETTLARRMLMQALAVHRRAHDRWWEALALLETADSYAHASPKDLQRAVAYYDSSSRVFARLTADAGGDAATVSFADRRYSLELYDHWALAWLARRGEVDSTNATLAALAAAEQGRARALLELITNTDARARPGSPSVRRASNAAEDGRALVRAATARGSAVLAYLATDDTLLIWFASPKGAVSLTRHAIGRDALASLVARFRTALGAAPKHTTPADTTVEERATLVAAATDTTRGLIAARGDPVALRLLNDSLAALLLPRELRAFVSDTTAEVVIVPQGALASLPFAALALVPNGGALGQGTALRYTPSLRALVALSAAPTRLSRADLRRALVVGDPRMPDIPPSFHLRVQLDSLRSARREAEWVGQRLGAPALLGSAATEAEVRRRLPSTPIAHFATHGFAFTSDADVRKSFVALAPDERDDGLLTVGEIIDSLPRLHAELVVLSACETGLGDVRQAEGTVGLPRALLARGARSVIVSLWNVDDRATALLMQRFYVHWLDDADHPTKSRALERAQSDVRAVPRFASARYWGAFQIVGAP